MLICFNFNSIIWKLKPMYWSTKGIEFCMCSEPKLLVCCLLNELHENVKMNVEQYRAKRVTLENTSVDRKGGSKKLTMTDV